MEIKHFPSIGKQKFGVIYKQRISGMDEMVSVDSEPKKVYFYWIRGKISCFIRKLIRLLTKFDNIVRG